MVPEITALATCVGSIAGLVKSLRIGPSDSNWKDHVTALADNIIDLQTKMLAVQADYQNISEVNQSLKRQIETREQWSSQAARYQLHETEPGIFVYLLKKECQADEPLHTICPNCFQKQQKSILIRSSKDTSGYKCNNCSFHVYHAFTLPEMAERANRK